MDEFKLQYSHKCATITKCLESFQDICALAVAEHVISGDTSCLTFPGNSSEQYNVKNKEDAEAEWFTFPSPVIEKILSRMLYLCYARKQLFKFSNLDILRSNSDLTLTHVHICYSRMTLTDFSQFMDLLSKRAEHIVSFVVKHNEIQRDVTSTKTDSGKITHPTGSIERILLRSRNLKHLDTDIQIHPNCLCDMVNLQHVQFTPCEDVLEYAKDILTILNNCPNLVTFPVDIASALELLSTNYEDKLPNFLLRKTVLRCLDMGTYTCIIYGDRGLNVIKIASITCPNLTKLHIRICDQQIFCALTQLTSLRNLHIFQHGGPTRMYLTKIPSCILEDLGRDIKSLKLENMYEIDFGQLATCFSSLKKLKVRFWDDVTAQRFPDEPFANLEVLHLDGLELREQTLCSLLGHCKNLKELVIIKANILDDNLLEVLLRRNSLESLLWLNLSNCRIARNGIVKLMKSCKNLKTLVFSSTMLAYSELISTVHSLQPQICCMENAFKHWKDVQDNSEPKVPFPKFCPLN